MKNLSYTLKVLLKKIFILSFFISFVCLVVILLIFWVIPLWDSATTHSPSGKELNLTSQEDARFSRRCTSANWFHFFLRHPSLGLSESLPLWKNHVSQGSFLYNFLSCLGPLWFGAHPYYSLNPYIHLHYLRSISIAKDCLYPK